jgi:hypothetical protein
MTTTTRRVKAVIDSEFSEFSSATETADTTEATAPEAPHAEMIAEYMKLAATAREKLEEKLEAELALFDSEVASNIAIVSADGTKDALEQFIDISADHSLASSDFDHAEARADLAQGRALKVINAEVKAIKERAEEAFNANSDEEMAFRLVATAAVACATSKV